MAAKSSPSNRSSIVSLDPAIASHIITKSSNTTQHVRAGSTPNVGAATKVKGHGRTNSAPSKHAHKRSNSLRRAKNSTEILRQRPGRGNSGAQSPDAAGDTKRGRNFSVTNVGTGGLLYLRPSAHQVPMSPTSPVAGLELAEDGLTFSPEGKEHYQASPKIGSGEHPKVIRGRSVSPKRILQQIGRLKADAAGKPNRRRSQSFSTLDESRRSPTTSWPKTLKIVINRGVENSGPSPDFDAKPSLEIAIPHYRLGIPRFSTHGTPILRNSTHSRTSSVPSIKRPMTAKPEPSSNAPPPASLKAFAKLQTIDHSVNFGPNKNKPKAHTETHVAKTPALELPLNPAIYDDLTDNYNDPSVVRFAHDVRDVIAASPARIIAQISSESFMDYELVSDFFLTFRSYMTIMEVLNLLLARLAWAIGRMSDDGRIIRIRTFAALRHWILNYFVDDFVMHRNARVRFCDEVNELYEEVRQKRVGGPSDLKILQDLKRCWNGRCSLYWDGEEFNMDNNLDMDLRPGGVLGSRDSTLTDIREAEFAMTQAPPAASSTPVQAHASSKPTEVSMEKTHTKKQASIASSRGAESMQSEPSIQVQSCSFMRNPMRQAMQAATNVKRPHPVTVLERRFNAPSDLQVTTGRPNSQILHRRGGSSFDSTRERKPYEASVAESAEIEQYEGSIIRGFVYGPVEPFVRVPLSLPLSPSGAFEASSGPQSQAMDHNIYLSPTHPATKNILGSIRRAISGRQGSHEVTTMSISAPYVQNLAVGRKSPAPLSVSLSQDGLRGRAASASPLSPVRIDLLCAAAIESYQANVPGEKTTSTDESPAPLNPLDASGKSPKFHALTTNERHRVQSQLTAESGSILIIDETGMGDPEMSGAVRPSSETYEMLSPDAKHAPQDHTQTKHASYPTDVASVHESTDPGQQACVSPKQLQDAMVLTRPTEELAGNVYSSTAITTTFKYPQSATSSPIQLQTKVSQDGTSSDITAPQDYQDSLNAGAANNHAQVLRRMPGGDLRKTENVHDLEVAAPHHESMDSVADTVSSAAESFVIMTNAPSTMQQILRKPDTTQVSMINTNSGQHLRASFEAAIAPFSAIPDDDDGGLEATLLKLEGRYDKDSPELRQLSPRAAPNNLSSGSTIEDNEVESYNAVTPTMRRSQKHGPDASTPRPEDFPASLTNPLQLFVNQQAIFELPHEPVSGRGGSHESVPLLQRDSSSGPATETLPPRPLQSHADTKSPMRMSNLAHRQELMDRLVGAGVAGRQSHLLRADTSQTTHSFLLDEDENLSDLSSEMSVDIINYSEAMGRVSSVMLVAPGTAVSGLEIPTHPLAHSSFVNLSMHPSLALNAGSDSLRWSRSPIMPPPVASPLLGNEAKPKLGKAAKTQSKRSHIPSGPAHIPFILACDSQVLAQQLTLVEQSALTEVEWSDLVEMRWSNKPANILDWAEYVTQQEVKGVDLVITRFNLMVKWAISEIVLTHSAEERVRVITKFIHVAAHARRLHNYATMLQITIALTSTDCSRLVKTWQLVSGPDKSLLKNMEALIQPVRNFHDLRLEMESANLSDGCIPFIGLYVHDLTYNAQKPAEIDTGKGQPPLINFERFRTAAVIVKGLLRLIDASSRYEFEPVHGIIERCLWIAALEDDRVRTLSRTCEEGLDLKELAQR